jgi:hypothetical protein
LITSNKLSIEQLPVIRLFLQFFHALDLFFLLFASDKLREGVAVSIVLFHGAAHQAGVEIVVEVWSCVGGSGDCKGRLRFGEALVLGKTAIEDFAELTLSELLLYLPLKCWRLQ